MGGEVLSFPVTRNLLASAWVQMRGLVPGDSVIPAGSPPPTLHVFFQATRPEPL